MIKSEGVQVCVSWRTIGTIKLEYKTNLHSWDIVKAVPLQLVTSFEIGSTSHGPFQRQCLQDYFDSAMDIFSNSKKDQAFSHEKVVITQSDACRWFYAPVYAKWLPLTLLHERLRVQMFKQGN